MRLRLPELLEESGITGYQVAKASRGRLSLSAIYSLLRRRGQFVKIKADHLDALCDVLGVAPGELFEAGHPSAHHAARELPPSSTVGL